MSLPRTEEALPGKCRPCSHLAAGLAGPVNTCRARRSVCRRRLRGSPCQPYGDREAHWLLTGSRERRGGGAAGRRCSPEA